jgi:hypothetical protein
MPLPPPCFSQYSFVINKALTFYTIGENNIDELQMRINYGAKSNNPFQYQNCNIKLFCDVPYFKLYA